MHVLCRLGCYLVALTLLWSMNPPSVIAQNETDSGRPSFTHRVIELVNRERVERYLAPLQVNEEVNPAASHAQVMANGNFLEHEYPITGSTAGDRVRAEDYQWVAVAESIAAGQDISTKAMTSWFDSPGHSINILHPDFREIGVGGVFKVNDTFPCNVNALRQVTVELRTNQGQVQIANRDEHLMTGPAGKSDVQNRLPPFQAGSIVTSTLEPSIQNGIDTLQIERRSSTTSLVAGEEVQFILQLTGNATPCGEQVVRTPLDVVLVIDRSGSMDDILGGLSGVTKLDGAKEAAIAFLSAVELGTDQVAIVAFDYQADLIHQLDVQAEGVAQAIEGVEAGGGTNIADGLLAALDELNGQHRREDASGVVILLSDGQSSAQTAAEQIKEAGYRLVTIGLGADVDDNELRQIASSPADYYFSPDTSQLKEIFLNIARDIKQVAAGTDVVINHRFDATNFEIVENSITPQARVVFDQIIWRLPLLSSDEPVQLTYRLRSRISGGFNLDLGTQVTYLRCGKEKRSLSLASDLPVQVHPDPNATPTPVPTPMPEPVTLTQAGINWVCGDFPWWYLLPFFLFLILLTLVLWKNRGGVCNRLRQNRRWPRACQLIGLLLLAYSMFLLALLLRELQPAICQPREAIYFWRITSEGESAILYKPIKPDLPVREFQKLNDQASCIACHVTSLEGDTIAAIADGSNGPIIMMRLDGTLINIPPITGSYLSLSPDGRRLAYAAEGKDIYILDIDAGVSTPLQGASEPDIIETMPTWSSDSNTIAFVRAVGDVRGYSLAVPSDIYTVSAKGGIPTLLPGAAGNGFNYYPSYSPDGRWLAFTRHTTGSSTRSDPQAEIYLVPAQGGPAQRLIANDLPNGRPLSGVGNSWPTWSPDGRFLAFNSKRNGGQFDIYITQIDPEGQSGPARPLAEASQLDAFEHLPQWGRPPQVNLLSRLLWLLPWLLPFILFLLLARKLCEARQYPDTVTLTREVTPNTGYANEQVFKIRLTIIGDSTTCEEVRVRKPVDVVLVMDVSGSMNEPARTGLSERKLDGAKAAALAFIERMDSNQDRVGLVTFNTQAEIRQSLDTDSAKLKNAIETLDSSGDTAIHKGLALALDELRIFRRAHTVGVIIILSDGQSEPDLAIKHAEAIEDENIRLITIAFGESANRDLLKEIASSPSDSHFSASNHQLKQIFTSIAEQIQEPVAASDLIFTHRANIQGFDLDEQSIYPRPNKITEGVITWHLPDLGNTSRTFRYQTRARQSGNSLNLDLGDHIQYRRCGDIPKELEKEAGLQVTVWERSPIIRSKALGPLKPPKPLKLPDRSPVWDPDAAILIGVGTFGRQVLTHLKKNLRDVSAGDIPDRLQFLLIDTAKYLRTGQPLRFAGVQLDDEDVLVLDENLRPVVQELLDADAVHPYPELHPWFPAESYIGATQTQTLAEGTHGKRPLARAGLIRRINGKASGIKEFLSERLEGYLRRVQTQQHGVRAILVGSLSEGMGSTLWDMAYLVREIARQSLGPVPVAIEGYFGLETESGMNEPVTDAELNALCSLRELTWFQLNPGMPYRIAYGNQIFDEKLQPLRVRLIDDLYLFTTSSQMHVTNLSPVLADLVTWRLDRSARMVEDHDWYDEQRKLVQKREMDYRELFFGTGGSFTIRLPAYDLIEMVKTRWAREMLHAFLMGETRSEVAFSSSFANDPGLPKNPSTFIPAFLQGDWQGLEYGYNLTAPIPNTLHALGLILEGRTTEALANTTHIDDTEVRSYLDSALRLILMGTAHEQTKQPRAGKIGYAIEFLEELRRVCRGELRQSIERTEVQSEHRQVWEETRTILAKNVETAMERLQVTQDYLGRVYAILQEREADLTRWREEMDQVECRLYLWKELLDPQGYLLAQHRELKDIWYEAAYQKAQPEAHVEYLTWGTLDQQGELGLRLVGPVEISADSLTDSPEEFARKLLIFTEGRVQDLWQDRAGLALLADHAIAQLAILAGQKFERIHDINFSNITLWLQNRALSISDTNQHVVPTAIPGNMIRRAALANCDSRGGILSRFSQALPERSHIRGNEEPLTRQTLSDRLSWQLVRTVDLLSPIALHRYDHIWKKLAVEDERRAVFDWEVVTKSFRSGFNNELLHPTVAAGLVDEERARLYGLAYVSGWVSQEMGTWGIRSGLGQSPLVSWSPPDRWDGTVYGLLYFVFRAKANQVEAVKDALITATPMLRAVWQARALEEGWQQFSPENKSDVRSLKLLAWYSARKRIGELI